MIRLLTALSCCIVLHAAAEETKCSVKISPQSVECHYTEASHNPQSSVPTTLCTVRLHATPSKGALLCVHDDSHADLPDIQAKDAVGNALVGKFREWEHCFDSKDECHIMVYDFTARPEGGEIIFDTEIEVPVMPGIQKNEAPNFKTTEKSRITIADIPFTIEPQNKDPEKPEQLPLLITYTNAAQVAEIIICDDKGNHLKSQIVQGDFDSATGTTSAIYVVSYKKENAKLAVRTFKPVEKVKVPVKFKASIGR